VTLPRCGRTLTYYAIFDAIFGPGDRLVGFVFASRFGRSVGFVFTTLTGRRVGFVSTRRQVRGLEVADRARAARQRDALVIIDRGEALDAVGRCEHGGPQRAPGVASTHDVDLRGGDGAGALIVQRVTLLAGDCARQRRDRDEAGRIAACRHVETVAAGVLRRARLAGGAARTGAALRVAPVGGDAFLANAAAVHLDAQSCDTLGLLPLPVRGEGWGEGVTPARRPVTPSPPALSLREREPERGASRCCASK